MPYSGFSYTGVAGVQGGTLMYQIAKAGVGEAWTTNPPSTPAAALAPAAVAAATGVNPIETSYSLYGHSIPLTVFGVGRIGGEIITFWIDTNAGTASFIISFGVPADPYGSRDLREIAFDSEIVWTAGGGFSTEPFTYRFYDGTLTQAADALETTNFGAEAVAYRPQILLAFENLPLRATKFGKIPYVAALFGDATGDDVNLGEALTRLARSPWVNLTSDHFETIGITDGLVYGGLIITQQTEFLQLIQEFGRFYPTWNILQTDKLRIKDRGANVTADITLDKTGLIGQVAFARQEPNAVPRELELTTIDPDADYTLVPSTAKRARDPVNVTSSVKVDTAYLPAIMDASFRQAVVTYALYHEEQARKKISFTATMCGLEIEPGDIAALTGLGDDFANTAMKVIETTHGANYTVEIVAEAMLKCLPEGASPVPPGALAQFAVSRSRVLVPGYAGPLDGITTGKVTTWHDQSGHGRDLVSDSTASAPIATTSGPNSRACCDFAPQDVSHPHWLHTLTSKTPPDLMSDLISVSTGYIVMSIRPDTISQDVSTPQDCNSVVRAGDVGLSLRTSGIYYAWNNDGAVIHPTAGTVPVGSNPCVIEWWHLGGLLHQRINGAGESYVASGDSLNISLALSLGFGGSTFTEYDGKIFELMIYSTVPTSTERDAIVADMKAWVGA